MEKKNKEKVSLIVDSLIDMIKNPNSIIINTSYFYHAPERRYFFIYIYLFKLLINDDDYLERKYNIYISKFYHNFNFDFHKVTNFYCDNELDLLKEIKKHLNINNFTFKDEKIYITSRQYVDVKWFLSFMSVLLDNSKDTKTHEINICYTIPNKDIEAVTNDKDKTEFLKSFTYYNIKVKKTDQSIKVQENNILVVKNAAINYLKHLKQFKHGLESEESYLIFYKLLKDECTKEGFTLEEKEMNLLDVDEKLLSKIEEYFDEEFYTYNLSKQVHTIENLIWQSSNDITLLEHTNESIDDLIDLLTALRINSNYSYASIRKENKTYDIKILLILIILKYLIVYYDNYTGIDYSLLSLSSIKPKYMNSICSQEEQELKNKIKNINYEITLYKNRLEEYKEYRSQLDSKKLGLDKYKEELEKCVGNINSASIAIARLNSNLATISKEYENLKKEQKKKYRNVDLYNYNHSIIRHICNSIIGCSFYLKTNNSSALFSNIIIFEDYERTDNSFYLEVSFKELLKISNQYILNGIIDQNDLPKLV